jgi:hypothetical protein
MYVAAELEWGSMQANMVKQLTKLVKVRFVDDLTDRLRLGTLLNLHIFCSSSFCLRSVENTVSCKHRYRPRFPI